MLRNKTMERGDKIAAGYKFRVQTHNETHTATFAKSKVTWKNSRK